MEEGEVGGIHQTVTELCLVPKRSSKQKHRKGWFSTELCVTATVQTKPGARKSQRVSDVFLSEGVMGADISL